MSKFYSITANRLGESKFSSVLVDREGKSCPRSDNSCGFRDFRC